MLTCFPDYYISCQTKWLKLPKKPNFIPTVHFREPTCRTRTQVSIITRLYLPRNAIHHHTNYYNHDNFFDVMSEEWSIFPSVLRWDMDHWKFGIECCLGEVFSQFFMVSVSFGFVKCLRWKFQRSLCRQTFTSAMCQTKQNESFFRLQPTEYQLSVFGLDFENLSKRCLRVRYYRFSSFGAGHGMSKALRGNIMIDQFFGFYLSSFRRK